MRRSSYKKFPMCTTCYFIFRKVPYARDFRMHRTLNYAEWAIRADFGIFVEGQRATSFQAVNP